MRNQWCAGQESNLRPSGSKPQNGVRKNSDIELSGLRGGQGTSHSPTFNGANGDMRRHIPWVGLNLESDESPSSACRLLL
jgi:hypothetical protein